MPPHRGRASRACASCRRQKTRCYEPGIPGKPCLRCDRLQQKCSLVDVPMHEDEVETPGASGTDVRLERLERTVAALLDRLGEGPLGPVEHELSGPPSAPTASETSDGAYQDAESSAAPVMVIRDLATDSTIKPFPDPRPLGKVLDDLISPELALTLVSIFAEHYGRWVLLDADGDAASLLPRIKKSPILFCACCLIAVRHTSEELAAFLAPKLYESARSSISNTLLTAPQSVEFFQAVLILCMWSTTVGQVPLSIDSWLLSGFALQHTQSSPLFATVTAQSLPTRLDDKALNMCCLWNHLCLAHLHYCVGTSRRSMLQGWQIERSRAIINSDHAINFEVRMVAEIHLYWTVYENLIQDTVDLLKSVGALQTWRRKWEFVLEQPRSQFLLMGFHFSNLLLYEHSLKSSKTPRARESLVSEMIRHSTAIIRLAMDTVDERTRHLSDHIYHMITFAAIIICRLVNSYEQQLSSSYSIPELDELIRDLVSWLHSIGLPCHAAHTLGNIIAKVHQKLRPCVEVVLEPMEEFPDENFANYFSPSFWAWEPLAMGIGACYPI
ncbi:hypothetical protein N7468_000347 [Penicillium chermesinum]|uniref:Transcriptional activator of proteases prtT n=1 Tax=Penicillium chermesinum TaxID=63820 RepID=A0A9W9PK42_9EURO|nr:uncharacterized protein N7468_000347 [Penicillium chermesinum]KAJ5248896.1 hypothetical protein N7468_000347 [Penicillium chermesinum]